ncbi:hypothetical protein NRB16_25620 [Pseudomonas sp. LJDD11]|nr:hypothetical protein [Pseudomonas sp. LJDD11]MCQ9426895.1 hypothetical protein [Pseudomonas sp. LJDD11]
MGFFTKANLEWLSLVFGLPVAFVSVFSVVVPPAWDWVKGDYSKLDVTLVYSDFEEMEVLLTNVGNRAAVIDYVELDASSEEYTDKIFFRLSEKQKLLKASDQLVFKASNNTFIHARVEQLEGMTDLPKKTCTVLVRYRQYDSKRESSEYKFECYVFDREAASRIESLSKAGVDIPWPHMLVGPGGSAKVPNVELLEWAKKQPLTPEELLQKNN